MKLETSQQVLNDEKNTISTENNVESKQCVWFLGAYSSTRATCVYCINKRGTPTKLWTFFLPSQTNICIKRMNSNGISFLLSVQKRTTPNWKEGKDKKQTNGRKIICNCTWLCILLPAKIVLNLHRHQNTKHFFMFNDCCLLSSIGYLIHVVGEFIFATGAIWFLRIELASVEAGKRRKEVESIEKNHKKIRNRRALWKNVISNNMQR